MFTEAALQKEVARRRTFAIISHPDAGKTTLTEKLLFYGGAIHLAGAVRAKANQRNTTSDWMEIEKQRGISISSSVLQFEYHGHQINLLDTPGHKDFSEDTYRTLTAADAAVMLIDAAKGVEPQTRKLFEVCRMRGIPIFTFMNKLDRPSRDPLDLLDELEKVLGIRSCPMTWPIGTGDRFRGVYDRRETEVLLFQTEGEANVKGKLAPKKIAGIDSTRLPAHRGHSARRRVRRARSAGDRQSVQGRARARRGRGRSVRPRARAGGPALAGVFRQRDEQLRRRSAFFERFIEIAPIPSAHRSTDGVVEATDPRFSGFIFKIQANMDPSHRDRVAFMRVCSGQFERGMEVKHARLNKNVKLSKPLQFFAQERVIIDEAWPGDIVGLLDTSGELRIGDTLCEGRTLRVRRRAALLAGKFRRRHDQGSDEAQAA